MVQPLVAEEMPFRAAGMALALSDICSLAEHADTGGTVKIKVLTALTMRPVLARRVWYAAAIAVAAPHDTASPR